MPELCCLEPSSLNRPHPPHSWAHRIFTAWRLIRDAFAVRERLGDPRVVPGFRYPFCPGIPSSPTPGSSIIVSSSAAMSTRPSPRVDRLGTPKTPAIRFTRAMTFVASWFTHLLRSASLLAPCTDLTGYPASGAFTSGLSAGWSPFPLQDITTTATGLLCWRDSHPLEWQLASLHLLLHRDGLAPSTPCRSPGALRSTPDFVAKLFLDHGAQIFRTAGAAIRRLCEGPHDRATNSWARSVTNLRPYRFAIGACFLF